MAIAILDAGSQYSKLIQRHIRELNVEAVILPLDSKVDTKRYKGIIISGGPLNLENNQKITDIDLPSGVPVLGICFGMHYLAWKYKGNLMQENRLDGQYDIKLESSILFTGINKELEVPVLLTHGVSVDKMPKKFRITSKKNNKILAFENESLNLYALQFHPEVELTPCGNIIFRNFLFLVCECDTNYNFNFNCPKYEKPILSLVSGGVDSTVMTSLLAQENQVKSIHINNGLLRKNESNLVKKALEKVGIELEVVDYTDEFLKHLRDVVSPEDKRKIIGDLFIKISKQYLDSESLLAQGTLRPDLIESGGEHTSEKSDVIKTHHNDSPLARELRKEGRVIEPLAEFHKDEVRLLGRKLGLPEEIVNRMPFPGPGLAVRIICCSYNNTYCQGNQYKDIISLPVKSVGVQGDRRSYNVVNGFTKFTTWKDLTNKAKNLGGRVVYIAGGLVDYLGTTKTMVRKNEIELLREADYLAHEILRKHNQESKLSQMPIILLPVTFDKIGNRSLVIRTFITNNFMTGKAAIPGEDISKDCVLEMIDTLSRIPGISRVMYDLTSKPPGTTEWE